MTYDHKVTRLIPPYGSAECVHGQHGDCDGTGLAGECECNCHDDEQTAHLGARRLRQ